MNKAQQDIDDVDFIIGEIKRLGSMSWNDMKSHIDANENNHDFLYTIQLPSLKGEYTDGRAIDHAPDAALQQDLR